MHEWAVPEYFLVQEQDGEVGKPQGYGRSQDSFLMAAAVFGSVSAEPQAQHPEAHGQRDEIVADQDRDNPVGKPGPANDLVEPKHNFAVQRRKRSQG